MESILCSNGNVSNASLIVKRNHTGGLDLSALGSGCNMNASDEMTINSFHYKQEKPLLETNPTVAIVYIFFLTTALVVGTFGNTMIIIVTTCARSIRHTGYQFIINLATADLCVAAIADPLCVVAVIQGEAWFNDKPWLCDTTAALCLTACICAFQSLTLASLNRYIFVCHNMLYDRIFTKFTCVLMCALAWVVAFLFEFPNFFGWGGHSYDKKSHQCIWDRTASLSYTLFVSVGLIGFPLVTMAMFFVCIFRKIYSTKLNLYTMDTDDVQSSMKVWAETLKSSKMLFIIFVLFIVLWTPYAVVISVDVMDKLPVQLHLFVTMLAHLHSSSNFIIYMVCNRKFRIACLRVLRCHKCIGSSVPLSETRNITPKVSSITGTGCTGTGTVSGNGMSNTGLTNTNSNSQSKSNTKI